MDHHRRRARARSRVAIACTTIGAGGHRDVDGRWAALTGIGPGGAVLVRPDNYVAWRSRDLPHQPCAALAEMLATILRPGRR